MNINYKWAIIWLAISVLLCVVIYYQINIIRQAYGVISDEAAIWPENK